MNHILSYIYPKGGCINCKIHVNDNVKERRIQKVNRKDSNTSAYNFRGNGMSFLEFRKDF